MSNILIIKHGSLGDIAQASGAIQDISENHKDDQIYLLTTIHYFVSPSKSSFWKKMPLLEVQRRVNKTEIKQFIHSIDVKGYVDYR